jgi:hypothetical protein
MTWSLQIRNGDLTLAAAHYGTVTGEQKLVQDFRAYLLERMGTDDMHPDYGSLLDGGRLPSGRSVQGIIGETDPDIAELTISTEIKRIANEYQARQLERAKEDRQIYGKTTLTRGEVLLSVDKIDFVQDMDALQITVVLSTATDQQAIFDLEIPIS